MDMPMEFCRAVGGWTTVWLYILTMVAPAVWLVLLVLWYVRLPGGIPSLRKQRTFYILAFLLVGVMAVSDKCVRHYAEWLMHGNDYLQSQWRRYLMYEAGKQDVLLDVKTYRKTK